MRFFFTSRRRHTRWPRDWSSDVCSSDLTALGPVATDELGPTLMHEHIVTRSPGVQENWPHLWDRSAILAIAERKMADLHARGIRSEERRVGKEWRSRGWQ